MEVSQLIHEYHGLPAYRYFFNDEHQLQDGIEKVLHQLSDRYDFYFEREYYLSAQDRPDFFLPDEGIAIEVKIQGSTSAVIRQLTRYAQHNSIKSIILVTSRMRHQVPSELNGKPIHTINLRSL